MRGFNIVCAAGFEYFDCRACQLISAEEALRAKMDPPLVEHSVRSKILALFAEMLEFYNYPDKNRPSTSLFMERILLERLRLQECCR